MAVKIIETDKAGYRPELELKGTLWKHYGNGNVYEIIDFVFHGEYDVWMVLYKQRHKPNRLPINDVIEASFVRSIPSFFGHINHHPRFERVFDIE
jgi:hypothetical protein